MKFESSEREYGYRTPDGEVHLVNEAITAVEIGYISPQQYAEKRAEATGGVVVTRTVTKQVSAWAVVSETPRPVLWTAYLAPISVPMIEEIADADKQLNLPEGYEKVGKHITLVEDETRWASSVLTISGEEEFFILPLVGRLEPPDGAAVRLVLVSEPDLGIFHAIHLPTATKEWMPDEKTVVVVGVRDHDNELPCRRDFWFGPNMTTKLLREMSFQPVEETP